MYTFSENKKCKYYITINTDTKYRRERQKSTSKRRTAIKNKS